MAPFYYKTEKDVIKLRKIIIMIYRSLFSKVYFNIGLEYISYRYVAKASLNHLGRVAVFLNLFFKSIYKA